MECGTSDAGIAGIQAGVASRVGGRTVGPLWIAGATGRLSATIREDPRTPGEDPSIFATALGTLAIKTFGDMGQTARLRIIWDRFIEAIPDNTKPCVGIWTVWRWRPLSGTLWIVAGCGRVMLIRMTEKGGVPALGGLFPSMRWTTWGGRG